MAGLDVPTAGSVRLLGEDLGPLDEDARAALRGRVLGFVFQSFQLLPALTALENVMLPLELAGQGDARSMAQAMLARVGLGTRLAHYPKHLSGGEQQRVALCRAMLLRPSIVFADEPTGALDSTNSQLVLRILRDLTSQGTTVVMVTHDIDAAATADQVVFMRDGSITGVTGRLDGDVILHRMRQLPVPSATSRVC